MFWTIFWMWLFWYFFLREEDCYDCYCKYRIDGLENRLEELEEEVYYGVSDSPERSDVQSS